VVQGLEGLPYETGSRDGLEEPGELVRSLGRRAATLTADVHDLASLQAAIGAAARSLGGLQIVVANAGVGTYPYAAPELAENEWDRMIAINLTRVWKTCAAGLVRRSAADPDPRACARAPSQTAARRRAVPRPGSVDHDGLLVALRCAADGDGIGVLLVEQHVRQALLTGAV
jgi:NAD(P)-dependent dehydrogenase (short-subunit alcohol dehydrogenase family)